jgi:hypothetical protein
MSVTPFPRARARRIVIKPAPMARINGALEELREIAREREHDPVGIAHAVASIALALEEMGAGS